METATISFGTRWIGSGILCSLENNNTRIFGRIFADLAVDRATCHVIRDRRDLTKYPKCGSFTRRCVAFRRDAKATCSIGPSFYNIDSIQLGPISYGGAISLYFDRLRIAPWGGDRSGVSSLRAP